MAKGEFYWAVIGDAKPEPVAVVVEDGERVAYTCGCADPFYVDVQEPKIVLISTYERGEVEPMRVPLTPAEHQARSEERERRIAADEKRGIHHGHRRFNP